MPPSPWTGADMSAWKGGGPESSQRVMILYDFQTLTLKDDRCQDDVLACLFSICQDNLSGGSD